MVAVAGGLLACVDVSSRVTGIVGRDCYPCLPSTFVYLAWQMTDVKKPPIEAAYVERVA